MPKPKSVKRDANGAPVGALKTKPAADYLSISPITLYRLVGRGLLKPNRSLRHLLFPKKELDRFLDM